MAIPQSANSAIGDVFTGRSHVPYSTVALCRIPGFHVFLYLYLVSPGWRCNCQKGRCSRITIELPASTWDLVRMARSSPKHTPTYPKTKTTTKRLKRLQTQFQNPVGVGVVRCNCNFKMYSFSNFEEPAVPVSSVFRNISLVIVM